jgi:hypothetical protein
VEETRLALHRQIYMLLLLFFTVFASASFSFYSFSRAFFSLRLTSASFAWLV